MPLQTFWTNCPKNYRKAERGLMTELKNYKVDQSGDIIKRLEQRISQLRKCFYTLYEGGMALSSKEAVKLSYAIEDRLDKLLELEKRQNT
jgi:hypothetical protein